MKKHNKIYKKFKENGFTDEDKVLDDKSKTEINDIILVAKDDYLKSQGQRLSYPSTGPKTYWKILNTFFDKCKVPLIPPLGETNLMKCFTGRDVKNMGRSVGIIMIKIFFQ